MSKFSTIGKTALGFGLGLLVFTFMVMPVAQAYSLPGYSVVNPTEVPYSRGSNVVTGQTVNQILPGYNGYQPTVRTYSLTVAPVTLAQGPLAITPATAPLAVREAR